MKETLYQKLSDLKNTNEYAFHMPGHKRNASVELFHPVMEMDITEIEGFDNLHHPEEIIKEEQEFAASLYKAKHTFFLINGSTCGVLAAISAMTADKDSIVISRNSHKSAYHAMYLKGLTPCYVYPQDCKEKPYIGGAVCVEDIVRQMEKSRAKVVFITSPTYEGMISDIRKIAEEVHKRDGILIVDEAHGAHLGFHSAFFKSAVTEGADIVIQSLHKTLPSLTQTALLHVCSERVSVSEVKKYLSIFQTSSPSYVLMASISHCLHFLEEKGEEYYNSYVKKLSAFYEKIEKLNHIKVVIPEKSQELFGAKMDPSKIIICTENCKDSCGSYYSGKELAKDLLEKYHLQMEMVSQQYVLAMTSICDTQEGFDRLEQALFDIDARLENITEIADKEKNATCEKEKPEIVMSIKDALEAEREQLKLMSAVGKISAEYIYLYPPGSPIITPGEKFTKEICRQIERYMELGLHVQGPEDYKLERLWIVKK